MWKVFFSTHHKDKTSLVAIYLITQPVGLLSVSEASLILWENADVVISLGWHFLGWGVLLDEVIKLIFVQSFQMGVLVWRP